MEEIVGLILKLIIIILWLIVLPATAILATPFILLCRTASGEKPSRAIIGQRYRRTLFFWIKGLGAAAT